MLSELAISYLFLGGAGAGALFLLTVLDLRSPWASLAPLYSAAGSGRRGKPRETQAFLPQQTYQGLFGAGYGAGLVALGLGALCLIADLGRIDRLVLLFLHPTGSLVSLGTYALAVLLLCGAVLASLWLFCRRPLRCWIVRVVQATTLALSVLVMLYTGLLFQNMGTGLLIGSFIVPVLFVLSSISTGSAVLLIAFLFTRKAQGFRGMCGQLLRVDCVVIALELVATLALAVQALLTPAFAQAVQALTQGFGAMPFWIGFVVCGLAIPFVLEALKWRRDRIRPLRNSRNSNQEAFVVIAALVLVGGFSLRWCVAVVGLPVFNVTLSLIGG